MYCFFSFQVKIQEDKFDKLKTIASEPKNNNVFKIENYDGLTGILESLQKQIFAIEGDLFSLFYFAVLINEMLMIFPSPCGSDTFSSSVIFRI